MTICVVIEEEFSHDVKLWTVISFLLYLKIFVIIEVFLHFTKHLRVVYPYVNSDILHTLFVDLFDYWSIPHIFADILEWNVLS